MTEEVEGLEMQKAVGLAPRLPWQEGEKEGIRRRRKISEEKEKGNKDRYLSRQS